MFRLLQIRRTIPMRVLFLLNIKEIAAQVIGDLTTVATLNK